MAPRPRTLTGVAGVSALLAAVALAACAARGPVPPGLPGEVAVPGSEAGGSPTSPSAPSPGAAPSRQFHLGAAANALVTQARTQAGGGEYAAAGATLERALRIEPDNPLLWVELGRVQMGEGNAGQADAMGRKALALATGDPTAQASAWRLIADSLHARGRTAEALEAEQRAASLTPQ
jgi:tetratricopeptide (TPR) repeat protein